MTSIAEYHETIKTNTQTSIGLLENSAMSMVHRAAITLTPFNHGRPTFPENEIGSAQFHEGVSPVSHKVLRLWLG